MYVELIEQLRCPRDHEETALVAAASRTDDRYVVTGMLGCPTCGAEYRIADGIAHFGDPARPTPPQRPDAQAAVRLAAFLELTDARGFALLSGGWCSQLEQIQKVSDSRLALVNPPATFDGEPAAVISCGDALPIATGSMRAAAIDAEQSPSLREEIVRAVRTGGRVVGPASLPLPEGVNEIDRDDELWVGEKAGGRPAIVPLKRGTRTT